MPESEFEIEENIFKDKYMEALKRQNRKIQDLRA